MLQEFNKLKLSDSQRMHEIHSEIRVIVFRSFAQYDDVKSAIEEFHYHFDYNLESIDNADILNRNWNQINKAIHGLIEEYRRYGVRNASPDMKEYKNVGKQVNNFTSPSKVFIVHGHDHVLRDAVSGVISRLGIDPIVLLSKSSQGMTIIEKFEKYSDVNFAVVLFTPDDIIQIRSDGKLVQSERPRQNVILELGYFIGKLGRSNTIVIHRTSENFEMLSDYSGVVYIEHDSRGAWKADLVRELKAAGFSVSLEMLE